MLRPDAVRAYEVLDKILANPEHHNQSVFYVETDCGTTMCFAGWTCYMNGDKFVGPATTPSCVLNADGEAVAIPDRAMDLLGLTLAQADLLFYTFDNASVPYLVESIFGPRPV